MLLQSRKVSKDFQGMIIKTISTHLLTGEELLGKLRKMRMQADDDEETITAATSKSQTSQQPAWMRQLLDRCKEWLALLPEVCLFVLSIDAKIHGLFRSQKFNTLPAQSGESQDPLYRLFSREGAIGRRLLSQVQRDLGDVVKVCQGELKQTNHLRSLMSSLTKGSVALRHLKTVRFDDSCFIAGTIPNHWRIYKVPKAMAVSGWVANFAKRLAQLDNIAGVDNLNNVEVWLGGLFFPEAYITATRQAVAHRKKWSLETLNLTLDIERVNDPGAFILDGMSCALNY